MSKSAKEVFDKKMEGCPVHGQKQTAMGMKPKLGLCGWCVEGKCEAADGVDTRGLFACAMPKKGTPRRKKPKGHPLLNPADR